jgi:hypothetical protein
MTTKTIDPTESTAPGTVVAREMVPAGGARVLVACCLLRACSRSRAFKSPRGTEPVAGLLVKLIRGLVALIGLREEEDDCNWLAYISYYFDRVFSTKWWWLIN